ncbi:MAG: hypothetical protein R3F62_26900 [Planctomycetota bacterium]
MTTLYLPPGEEAPLLALAGASSTKRRYRVQEQGCRFVIDVYEAPAPAAGTILAEVERESDAALAALALPAWAAREVTQDPAYTGAALAGCAPCA